MSEARTGQAVMGKSRLEAFSDSVLAIIITTCCIPSTK